MPVLSKPPALHPKDGCLPLDDEKALIKYIAQTEETRKALEGCPTSLVTPVPQP